MPRSAAPAPRRKGQRSARSRELCVTTSEEPGWGTGQGASSPGRAGAAPPPRPGPTETEACRAPTNRGASTSSTHPRTGGAKQTGLRSRPLRHIVRSRSSYLGLRARPGGGPSGAGAARGEAPRAAATRGPGGPRPAASGSPAAGSAREAAPRRAGRTRRRCSARPPARPPLPPAKQPAPGGSWGYVNIFPQFPHAARRERSCTRTHTPPARSLP